NRYGAHPDLHSFPTRRSSDLSLNDLADEGEQLRAREEENIRTREMARAAGLRIRDHLRVSGLMQAAREAIEKDLAADMAYLHVLTEDGRLGPPLGHEHDWLMPPEFLTVLQREEHWAVFESTYRDRGSLVI